MATVVIGNSVNVGFIVVCIVVVFEFDVCFKMLVY